MVLLRLTDEEADALRALAEREGRSVQSIVRDALSEYIERQAHRSRVAAATRDVTERYAEALRRLGDA